VGKHYLSKLFEPASVAVFGASERENAIGSIVFRNMKEQFTGQLYAMNPKRKEVLGGPAYASLDDVQEAVDLAVIATPAASVPEIIDSCGRNGVKAAVVITAGFSETGAEGKALENRMIEIARRHGVRIVGPNCLGIVRPSIGLNATFAKGRPPAGHLALASQSGAICTSILDWAHSNDVGFSTVVSMGIGADLDFGEILDYLVSDPLTHSILMYIEGIRNARRFMSALRAAARVKPVIAVKVGRHAAAARASASHTGALVGSDDTFDAALRRAGVLRVLSVGELFSAARALSSPLRPRGKRLAIVTNGGGPGIMATDRAVDLGIQIADLSETTITALNGALPPTWSHANPVDVIGDAPPERYQAAVRSCIDDPQVDGLLVILTPQAMTDPSACARAVIDAARQTGKPVLTSWMGEMQVAEARGLFTEAKIPTFRTPEAAIEGFGFMALHYQNQQMLLQTPGPISSHSEPDVEGARMLIESALSERRTVLSEMESKALLSAFRIPVATTMVAHSPNEALLIAEQLGFPIAMKINSPDITHKSDSGGVRLNLGNAQAVRAAYNGIIEQVRKAQPKAKIDGVSIEPMIRKRNGREVMVGVISDPVFGPVITFGGGGIAVEVFGDRAVAMPPLNGQLAASLVAGARISRLLKQFRHMPAADVGALEQVLLRVSEMVCELPAIKEMDINPLIVDENGALAVDARIIVDYVPPASERYSHMAICPYPSHLVSDWQLPDGTNITIRPIRPEDAEIEAAFVKNLSQQSRFLRFQSTFSELATQMLVRFTQIDYDREMAFVATTEREGVEVEIGTCCYVILPDGDSCEFAIAIADEMQGKGLGSKLMGCLLDAARDKGLKVMDGDVLASNQNMLTMMATLGFSASTSADDPGIRRVTRVL
jgi:acetyltransferase